jgi:hypothetical protein
VGKVGDHVAKASLFQRLHSTKLILWWSIAWAIGSFALAPLVNYITPFLDSSYANQWTPDIYWRLVLYWHGAIFIPWITVLAVLVGTKFRLDQKTGTAGKLVRESIFVGGFFAVPIAAVAGIFDVYDTFLFGIPLWTQIFAFLIGDEMAIALIVAMAVYPRASGTGYRHMGMPYYTAFTGVFGALVAAMMGHIGGWVTWFGPSPSVFNQYINSTMYPVLGYTNSTSVVTFTEDVVGSHSHLMLVALMAGVVALVAIFFGYYERWGKTPKRLADFGFAWMTVSLLTALWIYVVSGVGNYQIPLFFVNGANGVAGDDLTTGLVGLGAVFVLAGLIAHARGALTAEGKPLLRDPLFLTVVVSWITIYLVIPVTGFYINFNEAFYQAAGINFDIVFTRFHQDFGFFVLPALVTLVLALEYFGLSSRARRYMGYLMTAGVLIGFVFGEAYALAGAGTTTPNVGQVSTLFQPGTVLLDLAVFGGVLIGLSAIIAALHIRRSPEPS